MDKEIKNLNDKVSDVVKTLNRIYEDREDIGKILERVGNIEHSMKDLSERVFKLEKRVREDLEDHQGKIEEMVDEVKEVIGGELNEQ